LGLGQNRTPWKLIFAISLVACCLNTRLKLLQTSEKMDQAANLDAKSLRHQLLLVISSGLSLQTTPQANKLRTF
jgi:hypothetical protein